MSKSVEEKRIQQFRSDRNRLPYDDIFIARCMGVDRSTYSKTVNRGPITNTFLRKFYSAFTDELGEKKEEQNPIEKDEIIKQLERIEQHLRQLVEINNLLLQRVVHLTELTGQANNRF